MERLGYSRYQKLFYMDNWMHHGSLSPTVSGSCGKDPLSPTLTWRRFQMSSRKGIKNRLFRTNTHQCWFWVYPQFATITLDLCMHSLHNLIMFYSYACQLLYTMELIMQIKRDEPCVAIKFHADVAPWWAQRQPPIHQFQIIIKRKISSEGDSEAEDHSYLPHEVFALTWHADVGNIMHMVPCIAYYIH